MSTLINAGFGLLRALKTCLKQTSEPRLVLALQQMVEEMEAGKSLSDAINNTNGVFTTFHVNMFKAAEASGKLPLILSRLSEYEEKEMELSHKLKAATNYPLFIFIVSLLVIIFLIRFLYPLLTTLTDVLKGELPWPTRIILFISNMLSSPYFYIGIILAGIAFHFGYRKMVSTRKGRYFIDKHKLKLPFYGKMQKKVIIIRTCRIMETLLNSGIPIHRTLELTGEIADNFYYKNRIMEAIAYKVEEGEPVNKAFKDSTYFPQLVISMINIGEETGSLPKMLNRLSLIYDFEVNNAMATFYSALEPLLIIIMGLITLLILTSAFLPIYKVIGNM
ncbi:MAG: type II secretion system F family protein [Vulcanimicrobiota bacterium]